MRMDSATMSVLATPDPGPIENLLAPETILPSQLAHSRGNALISGERALMLAVLEDAIRCLESPRGRLAREALDWILANDDDWPFSFVRISEALGIDPRRLRAAITTRRGPYTLHLRAKPRPNRMRGRRRRAPRDPAPLAAAG
jgi:hypothetical protein